MDNHEKALRTYQALIKRKIRRERLKEQDFIGCVIDRTEYCKKLKHER